MTHARVVAAASTSNAAYAPEKTSTVQHIGYVPISPHLHCREGNGTPEENSASIRAAGGMPDERTMGC
jgi:hypothetical protein